MWYIGVLSALEASKLVLPLSSYPSAGVGGLGLLVSVETRFRSSLGRLGRVRTRFGPLGFISAPASQGVVGGHKLAIFGQDRPRPALTGD